MHIRPIAAGASTTTKSIRVSIALQQGKQDAALAAQKGGRKGHLLGVVLLRGIYPCSSTQ
jgi:hypothetical protein